MSGKHPAQFSDSIIDALRVLIPQHVPAGYTIFDPFAGPGVKLAALCDKLGYTFAGRDIEQWEESDERVKVADTTLTSSYPTHGLWSVVTSPTYGNGLNDHFNAQDDSRRLTYRNSLGRALHPHNTGRYTGRSSKKGEREYWRLHENAVQHWPDIVIVNVKDSIRAGKVYPLGAKWMLLLKKFGYIVEASKVDANGWRYGENQEKRREFEWMLVGKREGT